MCNAFTSAAFIHFSSVLYHFIGSSSNTVQGLPKVHITTRTFHIYCNYLIFFLPRRSLTVSLQASCQYTPDSRSFSLAVRSFSNLRSIVLNCFIVRARSICFSNLFNTESIAGQVMSGTFGAFLRIFDQYAVFVFGRFTLIFRCKL